MAGVARFRGGVRYDGQSYRIVVELTDTRGNAREYLSDESWALEESALREYQLVVRPKVLGAIQREGVEVLPNIGGYTEIG